MATGDGLRRAPRGSTPRGPALAGGIDWTLPWYAPWRRWGEPVAALLGRGAHVADALQHVADGQARPDAGLKLPRFVRAEALPAGTPYESTIARHGVVPTRDLAHDLFNGLVWLALPRFKQRLNALHLQGLQTEAQHPRPPGQRGPLRDACTLLDENGAVLAGPAHDIGPDSPCQSQLRAHDWPALFVKGRGDWAQRSLLIVGHALLEQLMTPRKGLCAHVWPHAQADLADLADLAAGAQAACPARPRIDDALDVRLAASLDAAMLAAKPFCPLPVLGIPRWWAANAVPDFYDDAQVFRPRRPGVSA